MATAAVKGIGTLLKVGDGGGPETFSTVSEVLSITGPTESRETIDVTNMDSANSRREKISALIDSGTVSFEMNYIASATQNSLKTDMEAGTLRNFRIIMTGSVRTFDFAALITEISKDFPVESQVTASVTLEISGAVTES